MFFLSLGKAIVENIGIRVCKTALLMPPAGDMS